MTARPSSLPLSAPCVVLATWFYSGLSPKAPGTMGSLAALPFAWVLLLGFDWPALLAATIIVFLIGLWASDAYIAHSEDKDPGSVVIDEVAGQWLALAPAALDPLHFAVGFVLFRLFDIIKPWPISWAERRFGGAFGIMIDDILAGLFAGIGIVALRYAMGDWT